MPLVYFHATSRELVRGQREPQEIDEIVRFLKHGPTLPTAWESQTMKDEVVLGVTPHRVYAYLGRLNPSFGPNAVALPMSAPADGHVTPFDTGGLIEHIKPICDEDNDAKRAYLVSLTWPLAELSARFAEYPGNGDDAREHYLSDDPPQHEGPHECWANIAPNAIWKHPDADWRWWTWEVRTSKFDVTGLVAWTCNPGDKPQILDRAAVLYPNDDDFLDRLEATYEEGASGALWDRLKSMQRVA